MPSLRRELRSQLERTVLKAREIAEQGAHEALTTLGVDQAKPFDHLKPEQKKLRNQLRARGRQAGDELHDSGRQEIDHLVGIVAYEHWHRMLFARFLAENSLLLEPENKIAVSLGEVEELAREAKLEVWELAGRYAQKMLPEVFRADDPALALPLARETRTQLERLVADLSREVFLADDSLGWTYQFWQAQRKKEVNESGVKIGADEISPVTQLFTEDYMVEFLLHNTLGAWWAGKRGPIDAATEADARERVRLPERDGLKVEWTYLRFVQEGKSKRWTPAAGTFDGWPKRAKEVTFLDPCMGSGHFAVFALPLIARLRMEEEKLTAPDAVAATLRDNIQGLELDERCTQIAAFNLALTAWKLAGYQVLPALHLACSGLAPNAPEKDWVLLAGKDEKLQRGMERLYRLFKNAPILGSLINPRAGEGDLLVAAFPELHPLLEKALAQETKDDTAHEMAVTARGLAKAAETLAGQFTLVATNVPYLKSGNQVEILKEFCKTNFTSAKSDLATCFIQRCIGFCGKAGSAALVTPQSWLYQPAYAVMRRQLLEDYQWNSLGKLGPRAFETISGEVVNVSLVCLSAHSPIADFLCGIEASEESTASTKAIGLIRLPVLSVKQSEQLKNPEHRIVISGASNGKLLAALAESYKGITSNDDPQLFANFWEQAAVKNGWEFLQSTVRKSQLHGGLESLVLYEGGEGKLRRLALDQDRDRRQDFRGVHAWGKPGVAVSCTGPLPVSLYSGHKFDTNAAVIIPKDATNLPAIWAFCSSPRFNEEVRRIDQSLKVTNATLVKVPFDLAHWQKVAAEKYPHGLPKPVSSDPTQWLFNGHPAGADQPLHVAVARLLGYQWPRQTGSSFPDCPALKADGLEKHSDEDGIVCFSSLRGERAAADRLRTLLSAALGQYDEHALIRATESEAASLENWLRDEFFEQHCALFHQRPFVWHVWDGRKDGYHALINYHKLAAPDGAGRKLLETLTYSYLGDWIRKQQDGMKRNEPGAEDRFIAAQALQKELEAILQGEPPYDIFVRWKPLHKQAVGWDPDINDGVRMNIRPFMLANDVGRKGAGILRAKPGIKWDKDRGTEPERAKKDFPWFWSWDEETEDFNGAREFDGCRWNSCHYTPEAKRAARTR